VRPKRLVALGEDAEPIRFWSGAEGAQKQLGVVSGMGTPMRRIGRRRKAGACLPSAGEEPPAASGAILEHI
jgi:hypothetical protein